jgi:hypothetical protein
VIHNYIFVLRGNKEYAEGYDRIFKKEGKHEKVDEGRGRRKISKTGKEGRLKGAGRIHRKKEIRKGSLPKNGDQRQKEEVNGLLQD